MSRITEGLTIALVAAALVAGCWRKEEQQKPLAEVVCSFAPSQSAVVGHLASLAGGSTAAAGGVAKAAGLSAVLHSSGAYIFTGPAGYLAGTLGTAITLPVIVTVGVIVGGSAASLELVCVPKNHPELVAKVEEAASEFMNRVKGLPVATGGAASFVAEVKKDVVKKGNEAFDYANRKSVELAEAVRKIAQ